jgi:exodeoxyribonuclease VII large subunit
VPEPSHRPAGIPGSEAPGPWPVGQYAAALRERLRGFARVQVFGEVFGLKVGRAKVYWELRDRSGALPC